MIYLVESIYPSPDYDDYCGDIKVLRPIAVDKEIVEVDQAQCEEQRRTWRNGYCDYYYKCQEEYNEARDKHKFVMFIVAAISGLVAITFGIILALPSVSSGLMLGGNFLMFFGTAQYWSNLNNWIRTLILGVVLVVLVWV